LLNLSDRYVAVTLNYSVDETTGLDLSEEQLGKGIEDSVKPDGSRKPIRENLTDNPY
jgi:hypothetical protein